ncbi:leucine--tRNA ligase [candidate division WWE3 bacterium]|nr:leucine--tRNA ligase [candidate division WWE3 bacterium]
MNYLPYKPLEIEQKWQQKWKDNIFSHAVDFSDKEKKYILIEFPYPSGAGLHVGHVWGYTMADVISRFYRMNGKNVLFPIGWDAFGLPAENYAIKTGIHPRISTQENIGNFTNQLQRLGFSFDWSREVNTTDPDYYKWTQWIFLQFYKKGLAYQDEIPINWCPFCKTGLADEEVTSDNRHERCGNIVSKKKLRQWMLKITAYADRLIDDLSTVDYSDDIKNQQINWIGKSEGAYIRFGVQSNPADVIEVFTTRADTLPGVTFLVIAPEHPLALSLPTKEYIDAVKDYIDDSLDLSDIERTDVSKKKTGVFTGRYVVSPYDGSLVPVWVADYVLGNYGTGAVMGVPAHDDRDRVFAETYELPIVEVKDIGFDAITKMIEYLSEKGCGESTVVYKLRDWVFSRQRYWGEPIPIVHCPKCGVVPVPEEQLPIKLPEVDTYQPTDDGLSPLASIREWVEVPCPQCQTMAERETNTMPNWAGSSWYYLRYADSQNTNEFANFDKLSYFLPVDLYIGGAEHTTLHLLYSRFWHKFLFDLHLVPTPEPYAKRRNRGLILGPDGRKMSKSFGNVINPLDVIEQVGADTLRLYELFMGPFNGTFPWNYDSVRGVYRFLERVWKLTQDIVDSSVDQTERSVIIKLHQTIKKVGEDIGALKFNTAVAAMMEFLNVAEQHKKSISILDWSLFIRILAPFAPFISEEIWQVMHLSDSVGTIHILEWPKYDDSCINEDHVEIPVQINGKMRSTIIVSQEESMREDIVVSRANESEAIQRFLSGTNVKKVIFVPGRLINFVVTLE